MNNIQQSKNHKVRKKVLRISTVPLSLATFCRELLVEMSDEYDVLAVSSPGEELDQLAEIGIPVAQVEMKRNIAPLSDLKSLYNLVRLFRKHRPDMVHSITPKAGLLAMTAAWIARVPVRVHSFTGLVFPTSTGLKRKILITTDRATCRFATHILPEGHGVKNDLEQHKITSKPLKVLGHGNVKGIDLDKYSLKPEISEKARQLRESFDISPNHFVFVFAGRLVGDKGINELISAFHQLTKEHDNVHLLLAGKCETDDPISQATKQTINDNPRIHASNCWINDLRPWYAAADALVFPSYREGFPNVVLEAGAFALPAIVTDINGSREIITDGQNGTIIQPRDAQSLYKAMKNFVENKHLLTKMGENARKNVAEKYEASFVRKCLREFYKSVL